MATRCKGLNSKCFLFTYFIIVGFLLVLWVNRFGLVNDDQREIPEALQPYLESPPRLLPELTLNTKNKLALTDEWFVGKWSFVYFSHSKCLPGCQVNLEEMKSLHTAFANSDFQFLVLDLDTQYEVADTLSRFLSSHGYDFTAATASEEAIEKLAKTFAALYLQTDYTDGSYQIEQEHHLFVVDPKGRVYATFRPPFNNVRSQFLALRRFYAQTE